MDAQQAEYRAALLDNARGYIEQCRQARLTGFTTEYLTFSLDMAADMRRYALEIK
jgi:hypothetical protein